MQKIGYYLCIAVAGILSSAPAVLAQTTITAGKTSIDLGNYTSGSGNVPGAQTLTVTSTPSGTNLSISVNGTGPSFFAALPPSGTGVGFTTPATITVKLAPVSILDALAPGPYTGSFSIFGPAGSNTPVVTVKLTVLPKSSPPPPSISVSPSNPTIYASTEACAARAMTVSTSPTQSCIKSTSAQLSVALSGSGSSTPVTATVTATTGLNISRSTLAVIPGSTSLLTIRANPSGTGNYSGTVTITAGSTPVTVQVTVIVSSAPIVFLTTSSMAVYPLVSQAFSLKNWGRPGAAPLAYTLAVQATACPVSALNVSPNTGTIPPGQPVTVSVQFNPDGQTGATCAWAIAISVPGAANPSTTIQVQGINLPRPVPVISPSGGIELTHQPGGADSESITLVVAMSDASATAVSVSGPSWLTLDKTTATTPARFQFGLNRSALAGYIEGEYLNRAVIGWNGRTYPVPITLRVCPPLPSGFYISEVFNNFGRTPGLGKNSISPGTIGVVKGQFGGSNGSGTLNSTATPGLPDNQDGDSITITDNGGTTQKPPLFYISPTQIDFLLKSGTPAGPASMTVTTDGGTTKPFSFTVVPLTPALVTFPDLNPQTVAMVDAVSGQVATGTNPMAAGRWYLAFGSGIPDPLDPDNLFTATPHAFGGTVEVNIGGVPATVAYHGSSGIPGLFQTVLMAGANTPADCFNIFELAYNGVPAGSGTVPFSADGSGCRNQLTGLTAEQLKNPNLKFITAGLAHATLQDGVTTADSAGFFAERSLFFSRNFNNPFRPSWGYGCTADTGSRTSSAAGSGLFPGPVSLAGGSATFPMPPYMSAIGASGVALPAGTLASGTPFTFNWAGSEIPSGSLAVTIPSFDFLPTVDFTTLKVGWTGAKPGSRLDISYRRTDSQGQTVTCTVDGAQNSFTPPHWVGSIFGGFPTTVTIDHQIVKVVPDFLNDPDFLTFAAGVLRFVNGK